MKGIQGANHGSNYRWLVSVVLAGCIFFAATDQVLAQAIPQKNVNAIGPAPLQWLYSGNPRMQQNESDGVESVVFPGHIAIGFNDYRGVNNPRIGEAFPGIAMSTDGGATYVSGLIPGSLFDTVNLGQKGGADPNLEIVPYMMYYNFIAFSRDGSTVPGVYLSRWYEPNREVGAPFRHLDTLTVNTGTASKFLDKPSFKAVLRNPADGLPDIAVQIPAYQNSLNTADFHDAYTLSIPAHRLHLCYSVFVGNDNNDGTKIECLASDDGGVTYTIRNKLSESVQINQGTSIATRNFGQDVVVVWTRFEDNNETAAVMYAMSTDFGSTFSKAKVVTEFCPFNQTTGAARFRTNALPVIVSNNFDFSVYIAARNDATETCLIPGKGNAPDTQRMSPVLLADDFDSFGEEIIDGVRSKDGMVRTSLNFSRIMMIRGNGNSNLSWDTPIAIDPQENSAGVRKRSHQFMPACDVGGGIETCTWYDSRLDKFNGIMKNLPAAPFVEDMVLHLEPGVAPSTRVTPTLLPAGAYEGVPDPSLLPPNKNNLPLRRTIDLFAAQILSGSVRPYTVNQDSFYATDAFDADKISSPSVRVTRFPNRLKAGENGSPATRQQAEWNYPNARLFRKGKSSFIGDYNTLFVQPLRQNINMDWISNQGVPDPINDLFASREPVFRAGWTSNRNVRGKVFYTGCDVWDPVEQIWKAGAGCDSTYTDPGTMLPLQGEDGSNDGPPLTCLAAYTAGKARAPLTRNQNIYTAALVPGISVRVVSAIKLADGSRSTFVLQMLNGSNIDRRVNLTLPPGSFVSFGADQAGSLLNIPVIVPGGSGNVRTVFDYGNAATDNLAPSVILTVTDAVSDQVLARIPLVRASLETPPLGNVQSNPNLGELPIDLLGGGEFYDLILKREIGVESNFELENFELENTAELFDLENLDLASFDLENQLIFFDLENFELENTDLKNDLYQAFDLENTVINLNSLGEEESLLYFDLENFELENFDLENFDLENFELENFELENFDLENFDLENFELENETVFASSIDNFELENFELENSVVAGDDYSEISWTADSSGNTTTGVDIRPIFSPSLAEDLVAAGTTVVLTVRRAYMNGTVGYASSLTNCTAEIVIENQILYAAVLTPEQILQSRFFGTIADPDPLQAGTPGFFLTPDGSTVVSLRFINAPADLTIDDLSAGSGAALFTQPGGSITCDAELPGVELDASCEVDFTLPDLDPPAITAPLDVLIEATGLQTGVLIGTATATDDVTATPDIVITSDAPATFPIGTTVVTWTATDEADNSATATQNVVVQDTTAPTLSGVPADMPSVEAMSIAGATVSWMDPIASDSAGAATVNCVPASNSTFAIGSTLVTCTASDSAIPVNTTTASFTITVSDTTDPILSGVPLDMPNVEALSDAGAAVSWTAPTASDTAGTADVVCLPTSGSTFAIGSTLVTCTATDGAMPANTATASFTITVSDTTDPILSGVPADMPNVEATSSAGAAVTWTDPTASDSAGTADVVCLPTSGSTFAIGSTLVTCTATDSASPANTATASFTITVSDTTDPILSGVPADMPNVEATSSAGAAVSWMAPTASDSAGAASASCFPVSGSTFAIGSTLVTCTASDSATPANTTTAGFTITVSDTTAPVLLSVPADMPNVEATTPAGATVIWTDPTASDIAGVATVSCLPASGTVFGFGSTLVTCTAADDATSPNIATESFTITVSDTTAPVITLLGDNPVNLQAGEPYLESGVTIVDAGDPSVSVVIGGDTVDTSLIGTYVVTYDAADVSTNAATQLTRTIFVTDTSDPVIGGISPPIFSPTEPFVLAPGETTFAIEWPVSATDVNPGLMVYCDVGSVPDRIYPAVSTSGGSIVYTFSYPFEVGTTSVTCFAVDQTGNSDSGTFAVTVEDLPVIDLSSLPLQPFTVEANDPTGYVGPTAGLWSPITADDRIDGIIVADCTPENDLLLGANTISCVATDSAGNMSAAVTFPVTIVDTTAPAITSIDNPFVITTLDASATVFEAELNVNVTANDIVDEANVTIACSMPDDPPLPSDQASFPIGIHAGVATCTATDQSSNVSTVTFDLEIDFPYEFFFDLPKGKLKAGSTLPVDFYYEDGGARVDTSAFVPSATWLGPFDEPGCAADSGSVPGVGEDSGASNYRWSSSKKIWQFSWQTPSLRGSYSFTISPPGTPASTTTVCLK